LGQGGVKVVNGKTIAVGIDELQLVKRVVMNYL
jgi:hypothetical protein